MTSTIAITHTSDWHLGKKLFKESRHQEHELFLSWLIDHLKSTKADILVIAGDIFDSPIPSAMALEQYYQFLYRATEETQCQILIISGNHDSGRFLEAPKNFLQKHRIHLFGKYTHQNSIILTIRERPIAFYPLPFFRASELLRAPSPINHESEVGDQLPMKEHLLQTLEESFASFKSFCHENSAHAGILLAHHMLVNAEAAGSENAIGLSGLDYLPVKMLEKYFDLVLMGHIHQRQILGSEKKCFYPGSPLPMRFSEKGKKFLFNHKLTENNSFKSEEVAIPVFRPLLGLNFNNLEKLEDDLRKNTFSENSLPTFVELKIDQSVHYPGLGDELRKLFTKLPTHQLLSCKYTGTTQQEEVALETLELDPKELFIRFYQENYSGKIPEKELMDDFCDLLSQLDEPDSPDDSTLSKQGESSLET